MAIVAPLALLVGVILGALGGGGAILTVPILVYLLHQEPGAATAGSLIVVTLGALTALVGHHRRGNVRWREGLQFGALGVIGSAAGSFASGAVPDVVLLSAFAVLLFAVAGVMAWRVWRGEADGCGTRRGWVSVSVAATVVGLLTGFFGVGGGFAVVPALVLALGYAMAEAVGTSLLVIVISSLAALGFRMGTGVEIDWPVIGTFGVLASLGSVVGGKLACRVDPRHLKLSFAALLAAVGIYVGAQNVPQLF